MEGVELDVYVTLGHPSEQLLSFEEDSPARKAIL
jgi:hypothetical protein